MHYRSHTDFLTDLSTSNESLWENHKKIVPKRTESVSKRENLHRTIYDHFHKRKLL